MCEDRTPTCRDYPPKVDFSQQHDQQAPLPRHEATRPPKIINMIFGGLDTTPTRGQQSKHTIYEVFPSQEQKKHAPYPPDEALIVIDADSSHVSHPTMTP